MIFRTPSLQSVKKPKRLFHSTSPILSKVQLSYSQSNPEEDFALLSSRQRARFYMHKRPKKLRKVFIYKKSYTFQKARQFPLRFIYTKMYTLYVLGFFIKFSKLAFIQKARHFEKSKTICDTFLYTKIWQFALPDFSLNSILIKDSLN